MKLLLIKKLSIILLLSTTIGSLKASDHIDGPITMQHQVSDITDLFVFSKRPATLTLVMNSYPFLLRKGHFTNKLSYNFIIRKAVSTGSGNSARIQTDKTSEVVINCQFSGHHKDQRVKCISNTGMETNALVGELKEFEDDQFKVFAGHRADPFFFSVDWSDSVRFKGILPSGDFDNSVSKTNILSIIVEFPVSKAFITSPGSTFAVATETVTIKTGKRIDRLGRPEITNFTLQMKNNENQHDELRDRYNSLQLFDNLPTDLAEFKQRIIARVNEYDHVDGVDQWENQQDKLNALANILLDDFLVVDISVRCGEKDNYFGIEMALLNGQKGKNCGGRKLTDDFVDQQFSIYVNAGELPRIGDGVNGPYKNPLKNFPYMAKPDKTLSGAFKRRLGALVGKYLRHKARQNGK